MNWLISNYFSSKGSRRTNNLIDSSLAYVCAYYFTSTNQSNQIQEEKLAPMRLLDVWSFGLCSNRRVSFLSQGWAMSQKPSAHWIGPVSLVVEQGSIVPWRLLYSLPPLSSQWVLSALGFSIWEERVKCCFGISMHFTRVLSLVVIQCHAGFLMNFFCLS